MPQKPYNNGLPDELLKQLYTDERLCFFSPVAFKGGCLSFSKKANFWVALTDKRLLYHAKIKEGRAYAEREGVIKIRNISSLELVEEMGSGCLAPKFWALRVNVHGAVIGIPFPNKGKGLEIRSIYYELVEFE
ncbi:MAG: hypothetical protein PHV39_07525 [Methanomicrobium sp.]|nr:hypothetical protein [Methanomicrobium sp.]